MNISRIVTSNQKGPHPDLQDKLKRHLQSDFRRPIPAVAQRSFAQVNEQVAEFARPIILDSGCGVGQSSRLLAEQNPSHWVIGIDQSVHRLAKKNGTIPPNLILIQANCIDFWRLALADNWRLDKHYLLFPNPWPKKEHLQRRWHGHPVFPAMLKLGGHVELRTNWKIYAEEFQLALKHMNYPVGDIKQYTPDEDYLTPFEKKYHESGQALYQLNCQL